MWFLIQLLLEMSITIYYYTQSIINLLHRCNVEEEKPQVQRSLYCMSSFSWSLNISKTKVQWFRSWGICHFQGQWLGGGQEEGFWGWHCSDPWSGHWWHAWVHVSKSCECLSYALHILRNSYYLSLDIRRKKARKKTNQITVTFVFSWLYPMIFPIIPIIKSPSITDLSSLYFFQFKF